MSGQESLGAFELNQCLLMNRPIPAPSRIPASLLDDGVVGTRTVFTLSD